MLARPDRSTLMSSGAGDGHVHVTGDGLERHHHAYVGAHEHPHDETHSGGGAHDHAHPHEDDHGHGPGLEHGHEHGESNDPDGDEASQTGFFAAASPVQSAPEPATGLPTDSGVRPRAPKARALTLSSPFSRPDSQGSIVGPLLLAALLWAAWGLALSAPVQGLAHPVPDDPPVGERASEEKESTAEPAAATTSWATAAPPRPAVRVGGWAWSGPTCSASVHASSWTSTSP